MRRVWFFAASSPLSTNTVEGHITVHAVFMLSVSDCMWMQCKGAEAGPVSSTESLNPFKTTHLHGVIPIHSQVSESNQEVSPALG